MSLSRDTQVHTTSVNPLTPSEPFWVVTATNKRCQEAPACAIAAQNGQNDSTWEGLLAWHVATAAILTELPLIVMLLASWAGNWQTVIMRVFHSKVCTHIFLVCAQSIGPSCPCGSGSKPYCPAHQYCHTTSFFR